MSETHSLQCSQTLLQNAALTLPLSLFRRLDFLWRQKTMLLRMCGLEASPAPAVSAPFPAPSPGRAPGVPLHSVPPACHAVLSLWVESLVLKIAFHRFLLRLLMLDLNVLYWWLSRRLL